MEGQRICLGQVLAKTIGKRKGTSALTAALIDLAIDDEPPPLEDAPAPPPQRMRIPFPGQLARGTPRGMRWRRPGSEEGGVAHGIIVAAPTSAVVP